MIAKSTEYKLAVTVPGRGRVIMAEGNAKAMRRLRKVMAKAHPENVYDVVLRYGGFLGESI
jgi:hypothetical protein